MERFLKIVQVLLDSHAPFKCLNKKPNMYTVKPVYNDHLGDEVSVVIIDRWSL